MALEWTNDLATGSGEIDSQHKELLAESIIFLTPASMERARKK